MENFCGWFPVVESFTAKIWESGFVWDSGTTTIFITLMAKALPAFPEHAAIIWAMVCREGADLILEGELVGRNFVSH